MNVLEQRAAMMSIYADLTTILRNWKELYGILDPLSQDKQRHFIADIERLHEELFVRKEK